MLCFALTALKALSVVAQIPEYYSVEEVEKFDRSSPESAKSNMSPDIAVMITTTFPQSDVFGVKLVNGHSTRAVLDISNEESHPVSVAIIGGSLTTPVDVPGAPSPPIVVRNLTAQRYDLQIPAGDSGSVTYAFATEMHPQDLRLNLAAILQNGEGTVFTKVVFNETVSVVEAPTSIFDPQLVFLYVFLAFAFGGTCYFIYSIWIVTLFPQKRKGAKGGDRAKRSSQGTRKLDATDKLSVVGADGPAVATGSTAYDKSWIPAEHLKRPQAKKVGSGRLKSRAA